MDTIQIPPLTNLKLKCNVCAGRFENIKRHLVMSIGKKIIDLNKLVSGRKQSHVTKIRLCIVTQKGNTRFLPIVSVFQADCAALQPFHHSR